MHSNLQQPKQQHLFASPDEAVFHARMNGRLGRQLQPRLIDLFAGAGGMTLGFSAEMGHSFSPVWANDNNDYAVSTYNENFGKHCHCGDIVDLLSDSSFQVPEADVLIGGPPCQGFSLLNKSRLADPRKQLWRPYMDILERSGATVFVMENVPQLIGSAEQERIVEHADKLGFRVALAKLCAADYGVPQIRWRAFIIGSKSSNPNMVFPPRRTHFAPDQNHRRIFAEKEIPLVANAKPYRTVRDAIADLEPPQGTEFRHAPPPYDLHFGRTPTDISLKRYLAIPEEGMNRFDLQKKVPHLTPPCWIRKTSGGTDLFGRLWWDRPSVTIRTEFFKPEKGRYLHPVQHRPITHREAARIQSFPDNFRFTGSKIEVAKQIGNAVPPVLAARLADCVYALLLSKEGYEWQMSSRLTSAAG